MSRATRSQPFSGLPAFKIAPLTEAEIEQLIINAGGRRAHDDVDKRLRRGSDFILGSSVIELKILEDEGLHKQERQIKLANLFRPYFPTRPTIVLDPSLLDPPGVRTYNRIMEGPVKTAVSSARKQLEQSKVELNTSCSVLWVINNGFTSVDHESLMETVLRRARNDSREIDAVVISGGYIYSDSFDFYFLWPIDNSPINVDKPFREFEALREAWNALAMQRMNALLREPMASDAIKEPIVDISFVVEGITFVQPAPQMGTPSNYFVNGRPRLNSTGITKSPPTATIFAGLNRNEWRQFQSSHPQAVSSADYLTWKQKEEQANAGCDLKPFITVPITHLGWLAWANQKPSDTSVHKYASEIFQSKSLDVINHAQEKTDERILPYKYLLLITEEIGQDLAFDISHLAEITTLPNGEELIEEIWTDMPMFFEQALCKAAAYAVARGLDSLYWEKDKTYAWS